MVQRVMSNFWEDKLAHRKDLNVDGILLANIEQRSSFCKMTLFLMASSTAQLCANITFQFEAQKINKKN
jgi:hypothetical protein